MMAKAGTSQTRTACGGRRGSRSPVSTKTLTRVSRCEYHHLAFLGAESVLAAQASECAVEQGQFWLYHDLLFLRQGRENSGVFALDRLKGYGREVDAALPAGAWDQEAFEGCPR